MLPAGLLFLIFFSRIYGAKNGNDERIECLSNDSTVLISVVLCLCKEFHIVYNCYQFEFGISVVLFDFNIILPLWVIFNVLRSSLMNKVN